MFKIIDKKELAKEITQITVEAPQIAKKVQAGQFAMVIIDEKGERIPLTLADWDAQAGTIVFIFQKVGFTTKKLGELHKGNSLHHILGPLGHPTRVEKIGTVICIGGGVGIAEIYPVSRAFKEAGNRLAGIIGSRSKDLLILENQMRQVCAELFITTDDGSYGRKGFVTDVLQEFLGATEKSTPAKYPALVYAIGPVAMMQAVAELTRHYQIKTMVSLNPVMVDATGMCGACRCTVNGKTVFGCVDGPDFDAHQVDFDELKKRSLLFEREERIADA